MLDDPKTKGKTSTTPNGYEIQSCRFNMRASLVKELNLNQAWS
jgi:hypothetical protein